MVSSFRYEESYNAGVGHRNSVGAHGGGHNGAEVGTGICLVQAGETLVWLSFPRHAGGAVHFFGDHTWSGFVFPAERTKTSGKGKKVQVLLAFVSLDAFLANEGWLQEGLSLWDGNV